MSEQPVGQQATPTGQQPEIYDPPTSTTRSGKRLSAFRSPLPPGWARPRWRERTSSANSARRFSPGAAAEPGIGAGEHLLDGSGTGGANPADTSDNGQDGPDASTDNQSAPDAGQSMPDDGGVCEDLGYTPAGVPAE